MTPILGIIASSKAGAPLNVEYLVIAGGGGAAGQSGGYAGSGGGGAGGYRTATLTGLLKSTNYTVTVGGGGAG